MEDSRVHLHQAQDTYKKLKRSAYRLREEFLRERVATATSSRAKKEILAIIKREEVRRTWRLINRGRGKIRLKGISAVEINRNNEFITIDTKDAVEHAIMENNTNRFHLAASTPMMQDNAVRHVGFLGNTTCSTAILQGTFQPKPYFDDYTNKFLSFIGNRPTIPPFSSHIASSDFQKYWRSAREKTSSSMSGRHFGHYKAAAKNPYLSSIHAGFCNTATHYGISVPRWETGLSVMLEKIKNNIKVDKLRAILLMEADFNFVNKLMFGHRLINHVSAHHRMPEELYGGIHDKSAEEVAIN